MKTIFVCLLISSVVVVHAQPVYRSSSSSISFHAGTPVEDIDALNTKSTGFLNTSTGEVLVSINIRDFHFRRSLMEQHFNENYMESEKFPKSQFKGKIEGAEKIDFTKEQELFVKGILTLHGVDKEKILKVKITPNGSKIIGDTNFKLALEEFKITRPQILWEKIADTVTVTAQFNYEVYKK